MQPSQQNPMLSSVIGRILRPKAMISAWKLNAFWVFPLELYSQLIKQQAGVTTVEHLN